MESEELGNTKKIFISAEDIKINNFIDLCRRHINSGKIGIFSYLTDNQYNIVQQKLIQIFNIKVKFFRCKFHAKDMKNEDQVYKQMAQYHKNETGHAGINENYEQLKKLIYWTNLKVLIQTYIHK